jgi:hypothetical protein
MKTVRPKHKQNLTVQKEITIMPRLTAAEREAIAERNRMIANTCFFIAVLAFLVFWFNLMKTEPNNLAAYSCLAGSLIMSGLGFTRARLIGVLVMLILVVGTVAIFMYRSGVNSVEMLTKALQIQSDAYGKQAELNAKSCSMTPIAIEQGVVVVRTCKGKFAITANPNNGKNLKPGEMPSYSSVNIALTAHGLIPITDPGQLQAGEPELKELTLSLPTAKGGKK